MSRIRSIHPGIWTDEEFVAISSFARLFFIGLWNECDDKGTFPWSPLKLKMRILPADNVDVAGLLSELEANGSVKKYEIDGKTYGAVRNFAKYQRPKKPNDIYPASAEIRHFCGLSSEPCGDEGDKVPNQLPTSSENPSQMEEEGGRMEEVTTPNGVVLPLSETEIEHDDFDTPPPAKPSTDEVDEAVEIWNKASAHYGWPAIQKLNPDRRKKLAARLSEIGGVAEWRAALVRATKGVLGAQPPPSWFSFDWLTTNQTNILKVVEGNYDRKFGESGNGTGTTQNRSNAGDRSRAIDIAVDRAKRLRDEEIAQAGGSGALRIAAHSIGGDDFGIDADQGSAFG